MKYLLENQETDRLRFRRVSRSDFGIWLEFFKDPQTSQYWVSEKEQPELSCKKWYENQFYRHENNLGGMNALIDKNTGELVGHCGLLIQKVDNKSELEIGYSLLPKFWKKGFAIEAALKCKDFAFENALATSLISIISLTNNPSEKVALKNGMSIDKETDYKGNRVNIFRIHKYEWKES